MRLLRFTTASGSPSEGESAARLLMATMLTLFVETSDGPLAMPILHTDAFHTVSATGAAPTSASIEVAEDANVDFSGLSEALVACFIEDALCIDAKRTEGAPANAPIMAVGGTADHDEVIGFSAFSEALVASSIDDALRIDAERIDVARLDVEANDSNFTSTTEQQQQQQQLLPTDKSDAGRTDLLDNDADNLDNALAAEQQLDADVHAKMHAEQQLLLSFESDAASSISGGEHDIESDADSVAASTRRLEPRKQLLPISTSPWADVDEIRRPATTPCPRPPSRSRLTPLEWRPSTPSVLVSNTPCDWGSDGRRHAHNLGIMGRAAMTSDRSTIAMPRPGIIPRDAPSTRAEFRAVLPKFDFATLGPRRADRLRAAATPPIRRPSCSVTPLSSSRRTSPLVTTPPPRGASYSDLLAARGSDAPPASPPHVPPPYIVRSRPSTPLNVTLLAQRERALSQFAYTQRVMRFQTHQDAQRGAKMWHAMTASPQGVRDLMPLMLD